MHKISVPGSHDGPGNQESHQFMSFISNASWPCMRSLNDENGVSVDQVKIICSVVLAKKTRWKPFYKQTNKQTNSKLLNLP